MAFAGLNVTFGYLFVNQQQLGVSPVYGPNMSSNNMTVAGTSSVSAPVSTSVQTPLASVYAAVDSWITVGPTPPDPSVDSPAGGRRFIPATVMVDFLCEPGDKVRWAPA